MAQDDIIVSMYDVVFFIRGGDGCECSIKIKVENYNK